MDEDIYLNLLSMHAPLTKKNVNMIRQIITPHENLNYSREGVARLWEVVIYSRELKYFAIYFDIFNVTYFIECKIAYKIDFYFISINIETYNTITIQITKN